MVLHHTNIHRLKEVEIMDCDQHVWFRTLLENSAPQLDVLTLCGSTPWDDARCCFSTNALHDGAPALRKFHIFDMDRLSPYELLVALQGMLHLQKLSLGAVLDTEYEIPMFEDDVGVNLLGLTYLEFEVEFMLDFQILQYLAFPSIKSIVLRCDRVADPHGYINHYSHSIWPHNSSLPHTAVIVGESGSKLYSKSRTTIKLEPTNVPPVKLKLALNGKDPSIFASSFHAVTATELFISGLADILFALTDTPKRPREDGQPLSYPLPKLQTISLFQQRDPKDTRRLVARVKRLLLERKALNAAVDVLKVVLKRGHKTTAAYKITPQDMEPQPLKSYFFYDR
ncbi:hypothetical protein BDN71DRAFT_1584492 [Pleurotus eryngii]|uniref:Uncharacterized protein n=1 Tax=Pleurotus eryngii TaxID=5323 RepID=A0A9P6A9A7_PLEER|nr:hypothetical protein BDN71DRAFT_1584492 [Pleurotus eryngii]